MVQTLWDSITEFIAGGDDRTAALQEGIRENVTPFVPPNLREPLGLLAEVNPIQDMYRAGGKVRGGDYVGAGVDTAIAATPIVGGVLGRVGANQIADTGGDVARAAMDTLLGGAPGRSASAVDTFVERANQRGPVPTMYSNPIGLDDYAGVHRAPGRSPDNAPLDDLTQIYPNDIYDPRVAAQYYGHMEDPKADQEIINLFQKFRGNPDAPVKVYRAVPKDVDAGINAGDWVTPSRSYAEGHGEGPLGGDYRIVEEEVRAGDLFTDANSIFEFGYDPAKTESPAQEVAGLLREGRADEVTDEMLGALTPNDEMELFDLYQRGATGMDLPMDEASRMARAREMGSTTGRNRRDPIAEINKQENSQLVHYGPQDITSFKIPERQNRQAVWATPDPSLNLATNENLSSFNQEGAVGIPIMARMTNRVSPFEFRMAGDPMTPGFPSNVTTEDVEKARSVGADYAEQGMEYAIFDPANIRSRFARFDPRLKHLRNLSAGVGGAGLLATQPTEQEREDEIRQYLGGLL